MPDFDSAILVTVVDETGTPAFGVNVTIWHVSSPFDATFWIQSGNTSIDGMVEFSVPAGKWEVYISAFWNEFVMQRQVALDDNQSTNLVLQLRDSPRAIRGTVRDTSNAPVASLQLRIETVTNGVSYSVSRTTDTNGAFELPSFASTWQLRLEFWDQAFTVPPPINIEMRDVDLTNDIVLAPSPTSVILQGEVIDENGLPQTNVFVSLYSFWPSFNSSIAQTDHAGRFQSKIPPGEYWLSLSSSENFPAMGVPLRAELPTNEVKIIRPTVSANLEVLVYDAAGVPAAGSGVEVQLNEGGTNYYFSAATECAGLARFSLWPGTWLVKVQPGNLDSNSRLHSATKQIIVGSSNTSATFTLRRSPRTAHAQVSVVTESGERINNTRVDWIGNEDTFAWRTVLGPDVMLVPGNYYLSSWSQKAEWIDPQLQVNLVRQIEETNFVLVVLTATNILRGQVYLPPELPIYGTLNAFMTRNGTNYSVSVTPEPDGNYEMLLADGEWRLTTIGYPGCNCTATISPSAVHPPPLILSVCRTLQHRTRPCEFTSSTKAAHQFHLCWWTLRRPATYKADTLEQTVVSSCWYPAVIRPCRHLTCSSEDSFPAAGGSNSNPEHTPPT